MLAFNLRVRGLEIKVGCAYVYIYMYIYMHTSSGFQLHLGLYTARLQENGESKGNNIRNSMETRVIQRFRELGLRCRD